MRPVSGRHLRPLLSVRRATTVAACAALGLQPWADPHNTDPSYQRVRLRQEVLPLLEEVLQGGVAEALARTADLVRDDLDALDAAAAALHRNDRLREVVAEQLERAVDHDPASPPLDVAWTAKLYLPLPPIVTVPLLLIVEPYRPSALRPKLPSVTVTSPLLTMLALPYAAEASTP